MKHCNLLVIGSKEDHANTSLSEFELPNMNHIQRNSEDLKRSILKLSQSDLVVTLPEWNNDPVCTKIVQVANLLDIKVIHQIRFKDYVQTINH